ncbi:MAG: hypothetical protein J6V09_01165 [Clostridia bacterium]|nr:hypothetical protein [Clostridia bacterium]
MGRKNKTSDTVIRTEVRERDGALYKYELIMREGERVASYKIALYSFSVEFMGSDGAHTRAMAKEIFADVGKAIVFFERLVENLVTPIDLPYVVEDEIYIKR